MKKVDSDTITACMEAVNKIMRENHAAGNKAAVDALAEANVEIAQLNNIPTNLVKLPRDVGRALEEYKQQRYADIDLLIGQLETTKSDPRLKGYWQKYFPSLLDFYWERTAEEQVIPILVNAWYEGWEPIEEDTHYAR